MLPRSAYSIGIGFCQDWKDSDNLVIHSKSEFVLQENMVLHIIPWILHSMGSIGLEVNTTLRGIPN